MRRILIFQHVGHEPLGVLNPMLKDEGFRIRYVNFGRNAQATASLEGYNGLVILGGPMGVYETEQYTHLKLEMHLIEEALKKNIPVLGICLGAQMMAEVLGSKVRKAPHWEFGWCDIHLTESGQKDRFFSGYQTKEKIFQLHQDTFDPPKTSVHLASSELYSGQAFRYGENAYGLQFHLEADQPMILRWLKRHENVQTIKDSRGFLNGEMIAAETHTHISRSLELARNSFSCFMNLFTAPKKKLILGSR